MKKDFDKTPSFYNNEEVFEKYLGMTSYYLGLQTCVEKLIALIAPQRVVELGSATGATSIRFAKRFKNIEFTGIDMREDVVAIANSLKENLKNLAFVVDDMTQFVKNEIDVDFILMLYSYHHILDPLENKITFLNDTYKHMKNGAYLCIAETFIPDSADGIEDKKEIMNLWATRKNEGYASTFWNALDGIDKKAIFEATSIADYCGNNEFIAGTLVANRSEEFLIQPSWLVREGTAAGFEVVINQPINVLEDRIILFKK